MRLRPVLQLPLACLAFASVARADETASTRSAAAARTLDRPHTMAELGLGMLTIPNADVCLRDRPCTKGDTSIEIDVWQLYRANRDFAVGAGATIALRPTTDSFRAAAGGYDRSHTRSYFLVEAQGRYYALHLDWVETWIGATAGGVIISDRYTIEGGDTPEHALLGPSASTVRTEGGTLGLLVGANWTFAPNWTFGGSIRYARWFLPKTAATTSFGDVATLTSQQGVIDVGIAVGYRIAL